MMFFLIFQNIVVGTPVCQYATAEFHCWYTGGPIRGERVNIGIFSLFLKLSYKRNGHQTSSRISQYIFPPDIGPVKESSADMESPTQEVLLRIPRVTRKGGLGPSRDSSSIYVWTRLGYSILLKYLRMASSALFGLSGRMPKAELDVLIYVYLASTSLRSPLLWSVAAKLLPRIRYSFF